MKFIKSIEAKKKILFSTDDFDTHEVNLINFGCKLQKILSVSDQLPISPRTN